jgi:hypothetical protein
MNRRQLLLGSGAMPVAASLGALAPRRAAAAADGAFRRVRPSDPEWPSPSSFERLGAAVGGRLAKLASPFSICRDSSGSASCDAIFRELKNPYFIGDAPELTQTCGWVDAWTAQPSAYAVMARSSADVAQAVNFARDNRLRLVVKGGGHSYLGASNAPDSLLVFMRAMSEIAVAEAFVAQGCEGTAAQPAITVGAGAI